ncbi:MAG: polysaccharide deacetylase family protein [Phycisphaerales bacterium]|nr:polysaccharide deacetylase family protein [Phycisphaerales bacterium]
MNIAIIAPKISTRLSYILDWIFGEQMALSYSLYTDLASVLEDQLTIGYGVEGTTITIPNTHLLFEEGLQQPEIATGIWDEIPIIFYVDKEGATIPFDLFSAVFYLLTRYEEYLPFAADKHQRFPATESILFKNQLLERPIVDEWLRLLSNLLASHNLFVPKKKFQFLPSYDIDMAWKYLYKGWKRNIGGYLKDMLQGKLVAMNERRNVLSGLEQDPYDCFDFLNQLHQKYQLSPIYFILAAQSNSDFDKNILPTQKEMRALIEVLSQKYLIGMHPSYRTSGAPTLLNSEKKLLEQICGYSIARSRQHYIKFALPHTYRHLLALGIEQDYSLGYGTHLGFRSGTSHSFYWYDLIEERVTQLQIFPFCFMDTTAHYELGLSAEESFIRLEELKNKLKNVGGILCTIFHNFSLGQSKEWNGWPDSYRHFLEQNTKQ